MNGSNCSRWPAYQLFCSLSFEKFTLSFGKLWSQTCAWCIICCHNHFTGKAHRVLHKSMACMLVFFPYSFHMFPAHCCFYGFLSSLDRGSSVSPSLSVRCRSLAPAASKQLVKPHAVSHFLPFWYLGKLQFALLRNHRNFKRYFNQIFLLRIIWNLVTVKMLVLFVSFKVLKVIEINHNLKNTINFLHVF